MMSGDEQAIREVVDSWMEATKAGDVATVLDLMTDDVMFLTPGREPFGKDEFRAQAQGLSGVTIDGRSDIREVEVVGDRAWIRNRIEMSMTPRGGETRRRSGYTLTILKKGDDGRWRLFRDANLVT
jgi:uncharacterized protein (TIGR02246 family)